MKIIVLVKMVPDVVEELEVAEDGKSLDLEGKLAIKDTIELVEDAIGSSQEKHSHGGAESQG